MAWAETAGVGLAKQRHPVVIELKAEASPVRVRQYPMSQEAQRGIIPHIRQLMDAGILKRRQSPWNTPLLLVKKPGGRRLQTCPRPARSQQTATALHVRNADKLMYGQQLLVYTPHAIEGVLKQPPGRWITNARLTHYQALLLDAPRVCF